MRGEIVVETKSDFEAWLRDQPTFAELSTPGGGGVAGESKLASTEAGRGSAERGIE
jgi:heme/copper-type cytochrome/quinol oxidase subunit 2